MYYATLVVARLQRLLQLTHALLQFTSSLLTLRQRHRQLLDLNCSRKHFLQYDYDY